jgi:hypothetical protein
MRFIPGTNSFVVCGLAMSVLAGCGGSSTQTVPPIIDTGPTLIDYQARLSETDLIKGRVLGNAAAGRAGMAYTAFNAVPVTGSADFVGNGGATIYLDATGDNTINMVGTSRVTLDFANNSVNGSISDMIAFSQDRTVTAVNGNILLHNGSIGNSLANDFRVDYSADLGVGATDYALSGTIEGRMRGTRVNPTVKSPVRAIEAGSFGGAAVSGATTYDTYAGFIGEN